ncbi:MAG: hypothetical protein ACKO6J_08040, partial [Crocinitomicaceae bacterium]
MRNAKIILFLHILLIIVACNQSKYVPDKFYLLEKNKIELDNHPILLEDIEYVLRQRPNPRFIGIPLKLYLFNSFDSTKLADKRKLRIEAFTVKIENKKLRYKQINEKRRNRAIAKNKTTYKPKVLKDTLFTRISIGERIKYKYGQPPVIMDTVLVRKTQEQMRLFLRKKGFYYASISVDVKKIEKKRF